MTRLTRIVHWIVLFLNALRNFQNDLPTNYARLHTLIDIIYAKQDPIDALHRRRTRRAAVEPD